MFELFLISIYYGCGNLQNGLVVLDVDYASCSKLQSTSFSLITSSRNSHEEENIWHARLGHIGQHRLDRLAKEGLLG